MRAHERQPASAKASDQVNAARMLQLVSEHSCISTGVARKNGLDKRGFDTIGCSGDMTQLAHEARELADRGSPTTYGRKACEQNRPTVHLLKRKLPPVQ